MKNRRIGPDTIMNIISGISILSWIILVVIFIMIAVTNPGSNRLGGGIAGGWGKTAIYALFVFLIILSISGIVFNTTRMKRKTDKLRLTPIFSGILAVIALIVMSMK